MAEGRPSFAVLGFRPHTYWTAVVALTGRLDEPRVLERRRIVFADEPERFVFHRAAELGPDAARAWIESVRATVEAGAAREIAALIADLERDGVWVRIAATAAATAKLPDRLDEILRAHSRVHAAEGDFYREVIASACAGLGLDVRRVVEREIPALMGDLLGVDGSMLADRLKRLGAMLGPPWSEDYKLAVQAAWLQLADGPAG